jgi:hypothetical protein
VLLTVTGLLLAPVHIGGLLAVAWILAIFTNLTAVQRVWIVWRQARAAMRPSPPVETARVTEEREVLAGPEPSAP